MALLRFLLLAALFAFLEAENTISSSVNADFDSTLNEPNVHDLLKRIVDLEEYTKKQAGLLEELKRDHRQEMIDLKEELLNQKDENEAWREKSIQNGRLISQLTRRIKMCTWNSRRKHRDGKPVSAENGVQKSSKMSDRIRSIANEAAVAFTAGLSKTAQHVGAHQNVVFDHVETNIGNGYNPHHGVFTAPVSGLYVFFTSVLADHNREVWCNLVVNNVVKTSVYARGTDGRHDQGSQMIVTQLQQGDDVAIQNYEVDDAIYGSTFFYSTFSGFLLLQNDDVNTIVG